MKPTKTQNAEIVQKARDALQELELEYIMIQLKGTECDVAGLPANFTELQSIIFKKRVAEMIGVLSSLLSRDESYITKKRLAAVRQKYFVLYNKNVSAGRAYKHFNEKHAGFMAGRFLLFIFDRHVSADDFKC